MQASPGAARGLSAGSPKGILAREVRLFAFQGRIGPGQYWFSLLVGLLVALASPVAITLAFYFSLPQGPDGGGSAASPVFSISVLFVVMFACWFLIAVHVKR